MTRIFEIVRRTPNEWVIVDSHGDKLVPDPTHDNQIGWKNRALAVEALGRIAASLHSHLHAQES